MTRRLALAPLSLFVLALAPATALAHPVVVDGSPAEWLTRAPNHANLGIVARDAASEGELIWLDPTGDSRTDLVTPEEGADLVRVAITADRTALYFRLEAAGAVLAPVSPNPPQVQIAVDLDRVPGSGQEFFAGFADTTVSNDARWEFLIQTQATGGVATVRVIDTSFGTVGVGTIAVVGTTVEIGVPWSLLGIASGPAPAARFSIATFREDTASGNTIDLGGPGTSNALDVVSDYGDPRTTGYPNTFAEFMTSTTLDYHFDVWFEADGDAYAPLQITRFSHSPTNGEMIEVRNQTGAALDLGAYSLGDEEDPDGGEGMASFPSASLAAGGTFVVARDGAAFFTEYGVRADAEWLATDPMTPDMIDLSVWATGNVALAASDQLLALGVGRTVLDVVTYGTASYPGVTARSAPATGQIAVRTPDTQDTDDNAVDFPRAPTSCGTTADCGACQACVRFACEATPGVSCDDGDACTSADTCDAMGACVGGGVTCDDGNPCTADACDTIGGCTNTPVAAGTSCGDGDACNGAETCDGAGVCAAGTPLACGDMNPCTADSCDPSAGCVNAPVAMGASCDDGDACTMADACDGAGACAGGGSVSCDDGNPGTADRCDPATGGASAPVASGTACGDGDACNGDEVCDGAGVCVMGTPLACDDGNACTADACDALSGCANDPVAAGTSCDDGDACTMADACDGAGACAGSAVSCDDMNRCTADSCDALGGCANDPVAAGTSCDDGDACTLDDACDGAGMCGGTIDPTCSDAGVPDAGVDVDAGGDADAAIPLPDAGEERDAGESDAGETDAGLPMGMDGGCSCRSSGSGSPGSALWLLPLLGLAVLRRRR